MASSSQIKTRKTVNCVVFGAPKKLNDSVLPTYHDVMQYYLWVKHDLKSRQIQEPKVADIAEVVALNIEQLWVKASIPIVSHTRVLQLIRAYHDKYRKYLKPLKGRQGSATYDSKLKSFQSEARGKLFDISTCKCSDLHECCCEKSRRIPEKERPFLSDQRTVRKMAMGSVDTVSTKKLLQKEERKANESKRMDSYKRTAPETERSQKPDDSSSSYSPDNSHEDEYRPGPSTAHDEDHSASTSKGVNSQMRLQLSAFALACDRTGVSDRNAATIASAVLEDVGIITKTDSSNVIDRMKVRRQRHKSRHDIQKKTGDNLVPLRGLYFDGRKDKTLVQEKKGTKFYRKTLVEEHIVFVQEPESNYIGHISPSCGSAKSIKSGTVNFLEHNSFDTTDIVAVGCDGTVVNTGPKGGVIRLLEEFLGRPLQWLVCQLHANELPLRHLLQHLDGRTAGPHAFSGPIGKQLSDCEKLKLIKFDKVEAVLPYIDVTDLSTDQDYLLEMCRAVISGDCSVSLSRKNPGRLSHSRWLTAANRILRLYVGSENPSINLRILVEYVVKVYSPMWFTIKSKPYCKYGSKHLFQTIRLTRYLSEELRQIVDPVIQRNGYFAHPENVLLAMISDERKHIREVGLRRIRNARTKPRGIRTFNIPPLNFEAQDYIDIISWQNCEVTEPPLTFAISDAELKSMEDTCKFDVLGIEVPRFPCHTQAVERFVKLVTEASAAVCGQASRDGFIRARLESRKNMPSFNTKAEYCARL